MSKWVVWVFACLACAASSSSCIAGGADAVLLDTLKSGVLSRGVIHAAVELPDGSIVVGGDFTRINGVDRAFIARIDPQGNVDPTWAPRLGTISALAADSSGTIYAAGNFHGWGTHPILARIPPSATGAIDPSYRPQLDYLYGYAPNALFVSPDGSSLYVSTFSSSGALAKLRADGSADPEWTSAFSGTFHAMALDAGGHLYLGGWFRDMQGTTDQFLRRVDARTGLADPDWRPAPDRRVSALVLDPDDGMLYAGGEFLGIGGHARPRLARIPPSPQGAIDAEWQPQIAGSGVGKLLRQAGRLHAVVLPMQVNAQANSLQVIELATGVVEASWQRDVDGTVQTLLSMPGGDVFVGGRFLRIGGVPALAGARLSATSVGDVTGWEVGSPGFVYAMARQPNGGTIIAGYFSWIDGMPRRNLARLRPDRKVDRDWDPSPDGAVHAIESDDRDNVYVGGQFFSIGGGDYTNFAKVEGGGTGRAQAWPRFSWTSVNRMRHDGAGHLFVSGSFQGGDSITRSMLKIRVNGDLADHVVDEWNPPAAGAWTIAGPYLYFAGHPGAVRRTPTSGTGEADPGWAVPVAGELNDLVFDDHRFLYLAGGFTSVAGWPLPRLARIDLSAVTAVDMTWAPQPDAPVDRIALDDRGGLYALGRFTSIGGAPRQALARVRTEGIGPLDAAWHADVDTRRLRAVLPLPGNVVLVGGEFRREEGGYRDGLAVYGDAIFAGGMEP